MQSNYHNEKKLLCICVFFIGHCQVQILTKKTYGFNDLEHCIEVINVTNAYEQEKIELLSLWTIETEKYNSEICQPLRLNLTSLKITMILIVMRCCFVKVLESYIISLKEFP